MLAAERAPSVSGERPKTPIEAAAELDAALFGRPARGWRRTLYVVIFESVMLDRVLLGFLRCADVCAVTPVRDGMNLVAKKFVAAPARRSPHATCEHAHRPSAQHDSALA